RTSTASPTSTAAACRRSSSVDMAADVRIAYARERALDVASFRRVLVESGLGVTRPIDDAPRLQAMVDAAGLPGSAPRDDAGGARCITDFSWCCYLSELAVSRTAQGLGIGKGLLDEVRRQLGPQVSVVLASMPDAVGFYERIGMARVPDAFWFKRER